MSDMTRRNLVVDLPLLLSALGLGANALAQTAPPALAPPPPKSDNHLRTPLDHSGTWLWENLPQRVSDAGAVTHDILQGVAPVDGGYHIEIHETTLQPGQRPHLPHVHPHVEFVLLREGTVDYQTGERHTTLTPGSVGYAAPNELHGIENSGKSAAIYFVVALNKPA